MVSGSRCAETMSDHSIVHLPGKLRHNCALARNFRHGPRCAILLILIADNKFLSNSAQLMNR
jgi:hypothetical protein